MTTGSTEAPKKPASTFAALRHRDFRMLWAGQTLSAIGDPIFPFAIAFWSIENNRGASGIGAVFAARALAVVATVVVGGVFADRLPRRQVMIAADVIRAIAILSIVIAPGNFSIWYLSTLVFVVGLGESLFRPAFRAIMPALLPPEDLQQGNSLTSATNKIANLAGPALAGLLVATVGVRQSLIVTAATFLCSVLTLLWVREPKRVRETTEQPSILREAKEGLVAVLERRWIALETVAAMLQLSLSVAPWIVLLPIVAAGRGDNQEAIYSTLLITMGVGSFVGALAGGRLKPRQPGLVASLALLPFSAVLVALALPTPFLILVALQFLAGVGVEIYTILWTTAVQNDVPDSLLGRVFAFDELGSRALLPLGMVLVGSLADQWGAAAILVVAATINGVTAVAPLVLPDVRAFSSRRRVGRHRAPEGAAARQPVS